MVLYKNYLLLLLLWLFFSTVVYSSSLNRLKQLIPKLMHAKLGASATAVRRVFIPCWDHLREEAVFSFFQFRSVETSREWFNLGLDDPRVKYHCFLSFCALWPLTSFIMLSRQSQLHIFQAASTRYWFSWPAHCGLQTQGDAQQNKMSVLLNGHIHSNNKHMLQTSFLF